MLTAILHQSLWKIKRFLFVTAHQQLSDQPAAMETKKLFKIAERVFEPRVCTFTRAARAPLDRGSSHCSPGASIEPVASDAGSAGCTRLSSRQVLSRLYSISTRQWRFLELYSTRLIKRPKPWCAEYKRKRPTKGHRDWWEILWIRKASLLLCLTRPHQHPHIKALLLWDVAGNAKDAVQSCQYQMLLLPRLRASPLCQQKRHPSPKTVHSF